MFKKLFNKLLDYVAYIILGLLGLGIFNALYLAWFTDTGRFILSLVMIIVSIIWAIVRVLKRDKYEKI